MRWVSILLLLVLGACSSFSDESVEEAARDKCFGLTGDWMEGINRGISFSPAQYQYCVGYWTSCKIDFHLKRLDADGTADLTHFANQRARIECPLEGDKCRLLRDGERLTVDCGRGPLVYQKAVKSG